jgi:hypothetical protein
MSQAPDQYISSEESADVEAALLTSSEKFLTRLTISSQRFLQKISQDYQVSIEQLSHQQIIQWFENDSKAKREQEDDPETLKW